MPRRPQRKKATKSNKASSARGKGKADQSTRRVSGSARAGLSMPVGRIKKYMKRGRFASRVGMDAAVYLAAVLEYATAELLELAGDCTKEARKKTISPRYIMLAIKGDEELNRLLGSNIIIPHSGSVTYVHPNLLPDKGKKKAKKKQTNEADEQDKE
eukprot:CAMPEP_0197030930 /NCGR_PEP_ID=MMETSP1384-20130603/10057_1 /TAXON_ID=29189 /ORGANISM="Ammonia sp." /LENGTH=156 /DNA_ID=CAMNT_0042460367 /DNA_START=108 /DNA_END=578 /DNA_ORIENTATION=+